MFTPQLYLQSVLDLETSHVRALGLKGLLLDVDCTLKDYRCHDFSDDVLKWIEGMKSEGIGLCLVSNGGSRRISGYAEKFGITYVARALKPFPFGCLRAVRQLGLAAREVAMVGDQVFADVMAGRLAGLRTILVRPTSPDEPWFTQLKRPFERQLLRCLSLPTLDTLTTSAPHVLRNHDNQPC